MYVCGHLIQNKVRRYFERQVVTVILILILPSFGKPICGDMLYLVCYL